MSLSYLFVILSSDLNILKSFCLYHLLQLAYSFSVSLSTRLQAVEDFTLVSVSFHPGYYRMLFYTILIGLKVSSTIESQSKVPVLDCYCTEVTRVITVQTETFLLA